MSEKKKEYIRCRKCGIELSWEELGSGKLQNVLGGIYDLGHLCFICKGDAERDLGLRPRGDES